ncbi:MAG: urea ABC transporter ATP-binding protein UrtD [Acidobacteriota bacterium]|nr:urea ABC transporter ATP-binding protein UrtD [Acidobacteriota bacterium]
MTNGPLLQVEHLTVSFDDFKAIDDLSLTLEPQSVRVLIGPNGAGKSTLLDAIIGRVRPSAGRIVLRGTDITRMPAHRIVRAGICRKFQTPGLLDSLTVYENLALADARGRGWRAALRTRPTRDQQVRTEQILQLTGLTAERHRPAGRLAHGQKQWLEIGMVVASDAELLLLDEPAAGMSHGEREQTADLVQRLTTRHSVLVIDHDMAFVERLRAPVSVLHMGRLLKEGTLQEVRQDPQVRAVYLGRADELECDCA